MGINQKPAVSTTAGFLVLVRRFQEIEGAPLVRGTQPFLIGRLILADENNQTNPPGNTRGE